MTCSSSRIDPAARRLLSSIAGTRDARVSAMALAHMRGAGKTLMDAGLIVQRGSAMSVVAEDDLDDTPTSVIAHPITGHHGHLGNAVWHDERASARRQVYALDMAAVSSAGGRPARLLTRQRPGAVSRWRGAGFRDGATAEATGTCRDLGRPRSDDAGSVRGVPPAR